MEPLLPKTLPDRLYATRPAQPGSFRFDAEVAAVFTDMIERSVPGYRSSLNLIALLAGRYLQAGTRGYDLGASLGAATWAMRHNSDKKDIELVAVDSSPEMVERCRNLAAQLPGCPTQVVLGDIETVPIHNASMVVLNYTLQFVPPERRLALLTRIHRGLVPGGVLVLSEKLAFSDTDQNDMLRQLHLDFKRAHGYSELEISRKRTSLENVLVSDTEDAHRKRLGEAGFAAPTKALQHINFAVFVARK